MNVLQPHVSVELRQEISAAMKMHQFIMEQFPSSLAIRDDRMNLFVAYVHLADDFMASIVQLLSMGGGTDGGAFALIRPFYEASTMGQWLYFCASEENVQRAHAGHQVSPGLPNMMEALDKVIGQKVFDGLRKHVKTMHGYTHGGIEQLGRRFDAAGNLRASYSDEEKKEVLRSTVASYTLLASVFSQIVFGGPEETAQSAALHKRFVEIYGATDEASA